MSAAQNLAYAAVQVAHNFGAVALAGGSFAAALVKSENVRKNLAWLALAGWGTQAVSGAAFGAVSFYFYRRLPDISGIALDSLIIKMVCVAAGIALLAAYLTWGSTWREGRQNGAWLASSALAVVALSAAAFLRWFS